MTVAYLFEGQVMRMSVSLKSEKGEAFVPVETALGLMIQFGIFTATIIFGIVQLVDQKNTKK